MKELLSSNDIIRNNVRYYRLKNCYTQKQVSEHLNIDEKHFNRLENGYYNFTLENLDLLAQLFNKEPWEFLKERHKFDEK